MESQNSELPSALASSVSDVADRLIVALDFPSAEIAIELVNELQGVCRWFKVGMELYYASGNRIIDYLRERGFDVFLDLKLHDIPNTVAAAVRTLASSGASLLTVHASGGERMLCAAAEAANRPGAPKLLGVTVLTSMEPAEIASIGIGNMADPNLVEVQVLRLSALARQAGLDGIVCSPQEVTKVREVMGPEATLVIPGIRPSGSVGDDQRRTATACEAIARGASKLVVGRPITKAENPAAAATAILDEIRRVG